MLQHLWYLLSGAWRETPTCWSRVIEVNVWVPWPTYLFVQPAAFLKRYTVPKQSFKVASVNDAEICLPFRSSNISKNQANWGAVEAPCSLHHWLGSELHSILCSHLSETLRLFATQTVGDAWKWSVFPHWFNLYFIIFILPHALLSSRYFEHS